MMCSASRSCGRPLIGFTLRPKDIVMRNRFLFLIAVLVLATMNIASAIDPKQVVLRIEDGQLAMTSSDGSVARCEQMTLTLGTTPMEFKVVDGMIEIKVGD